MNEQGSLIIFAKSPVIGQVKTRLIPDIGQYQATAIYKELLTTTLATAVESKISDIQLWVHGDIQHQYFLNLKNRERFKFYKQTGKNLGQRMLNAITCVLDKYPYVVLIGSDCPELLSSDIHKAMTLLDKGKDLVLGPAKDGGYYLIGLRKHTPELFIGINWGAADVLDETVLRANELELDTGFLSKRNDVDLFCDLQAYYSLKSQEPAS
ncbi:MAG: glycosyltransferase [Proteobacteria bacterium]|nr:glycosyltransferase [Pseudomonadota bacterium]NOG58910.1 glycosyltransferase [Pseudomonadota bacterium]